MPPVSVIMRRTRRRTMRVAGLSLTAFGAVGAAIAIVLASPSGPAGHAGPAGHGHKPPQVSKLRSGRVTLTKPYAVVLRLSGPVVVNMRTGRTIGRVRFPGHFLGAWWAAAAADDRTFVLNASAGNDGAQFYLLRLGRNGEPRKATPLPITLPEYAQIYGMALTADGTKLALAWQNPPVGIERSRIEVFSLATGATRTWSSTEGGAGDVSWDGDRLLAFDWQDNGSQNHGGVRLLDTSAPGSSPLASRLLIPYATIYAGLSLPSDPVFTSNRSALFILMAPASDVSTAIVEFSATTGKPLSVLTRPESRNGPQFCGILQADPTGRQVIAQCGTLQVAINGTQVTQIKLPLSLRAPVLGYSDTFAW